MLPPVSFLDLRCSQLGAQQRRDVIFGVTTQRGMLRSSWGTEVYQEVDESGTLRPLTLFARFAKGHIHSPAYNHAALQRIPIASTDPDCILALETSCSKYCKMRTAVRTYCSMKQERTTGQLRIQVLSAKVRRRMNKRVTLSRARACSRLRVQDSFQDVG